MYAIIETGGKQYRVQEGDTIFVEKLGLEESANVVFDKVIALSTDDGMKTGDPYVEGAKVTGKLVKNGKDAKIVVFKFKAKKNYRNRRGHRQPYSKVSIEAIQA